MSAPFGIAGHAGGDVRSDCQVRVTLDGLGAFALRSPVAPMYGRRIREVAQQTLAGFGVPDASLDIEDSGALDHVLAARIEAALQRAGVSVEPEVRQALGPGSSGLDTVVTRLYLPGDTPKLFPNAKLFGADALILDLEDAVSPQDKDQALILVRRTLEAIDFGTSQRWVRLNAHRAMDEAAALLGLADAFILPKCEDPEAVAEFAFAVAPTPVTALLETSLGVVRAFDIATCAPNVSGLAVGLEDLCRDLGVERTESGEETIWAQGAVVLAAKAAGISVSASVYSKVDDDAGLAAYALACRRMGFDGVGCIHPRQVPIVQCVFAPSEAEVARARRICEAFDAAEGGVVLVDGAMVDLPVAERARAVLKRAGATR